MIKTLEIPQFDTYQAEVTFWDNLDTADFMEDDGEWFQFQTEGMRALRIAILPDLAVKLLHSARSQGVSVETLVNVLVAEHLYQSPKENAILTN
jgi:hypothetical protein